MRPAIRVAGFVRIQGGALGSLDFYESSYGKEFYGASRDWIEISTHLMTTSCCDTISTRL